MKKYLFLKSPFLLIVICMVVSLFTFIGCKDKEENNNTITKNKILSLSNCKDNNAKDGNEYEYSFSYNVVGNTLYIDKVNQYYNCCADTITISSNISNDTLYIFENEYPMAACNCICPRDINYSITNIPSGEYAVKIIDTIFSIQINQ
ncbi:MAG: hypothetical protein WCR29_01600 [Bacteroidales bacterium]